VARKKNAGSLASPDLDLEGRPFLWWAGETQHRYERLRSAALSGERDAIEELLEHGTALFAPRCTGSTRGTWQLRRQRAPVRSGNFSLAELLVEIGAVERVSEGALFDAQCSGVGR
jgi:hypothetical protein